MKSFRPHLALAVIAFVSLIAFILACARSSPSENAAYFSVSGTRQPSGTGINQPSNLQQPDPNQVVNYPTPTPDDPHPLPSARQEEEQYIVQAGDTLGIIAQKYAVSVEAIAQANDLANPNILDVGQVLAIPVATPEGMGPDFKIIPDPELVNGPGVVGFPLEEFIANQAGFLANYTEELDGQPSSGAAIVRRVSENFSVNPRLLLAVLEHQSGWVTQANPANLNRQFPIGVRNPNRKGLYRELAWAANNLNRGYYLWRVNGTATWILNDNTVVPIAPTINAGTAGVQHMFSQLLGLSDWNQAVTGDGLMATYSRLFGYPFAYGVEPVIPENLVQPSLQLPFELGATWSFTGGPHGGWDSGSAWAALDFAPPGNALGCVPNDAWVTAVADGVVIRTGEGQVIQDLDGDGYEQTGWVILYMHIESRDRVKPGTVLKAGDRIGHASCEGGISSGTHLHIARKYNGEWIPADQNVPFVMDGWVSSGDGNEYDGFLQRNRRKIEAYAGRSDDNAIRR
jgi:LasA protease